jgi:hypothetical protein
MGILPAGLWAQEATRQQHVTVDRNQKVFIGSGRRSMAMLHHIFGLLGGLSLTGETV